MQTTPKTSLKTSQHRTHSEQHQFDALFQRSRRRTYNLAYRLTGNATDAEDVTQDAYLRAWHHFDDYDPSRSFEGWLFRILTNRVIDLQRRRKRCPTYSLDALMQSDEKQPLTHEFAAPHSNPEEIVLGPIREEGLQNALFALPKKYRQTLLLWAVEERTYREIAETMNCNIGTVRSRMYRARRILAEYTM